MNNKLTKEQEISIIEKKNKGYTIKEILVEFNIKTPKTIYDVIGRNGKDKLVPNKNYYV